MSKLNHEFNDFLIMKYDDDDETDNDFLYFMRKMRQIIMDND